MPKNQNYAPGYYEMIKEPMDLGLMSKKIKANKYTSKALFVYVTPSLPPSLPHSLTHSRTHSRTHSLTHSLTPDTT